MYDTIWVFFFAQCINLRHENYLFIVLLSYNLGVVRFARFTRKQMDKLSILVRFPPLGQDLRIRWWISECK